MKFIFYALLSMTLVACASKREPSSVKQEDVSRGLNTDYYFTR